MNAVEELKQEFQNNSPGWLGATVITGRHQDPKAIPISPGERIFLSREEQILTSRAHQRDEDSPFNNGLDPVAEPGAVLQDRRLPFDEKAPEAEAEVEVTGVEPQPAGEAGVGVQAAQEIPGTPEAQPPKQQRAQRPAEAKAPAPATSPSPPKSLTTP